MNTLLVNGSSRYQRYAIETGNNLNAPSGIYYATQTLVIPQYTVIEGSPDMGVLTFSQSIDVTPAPLYTGSDLALVGSPSILFGFGDYGYASAGDLGLDGLKRGFQDPLGAWRF